MRRTLRTGIAVASIAAALLLVVFVSQAPAETSLCTLGSGGGQCNEPVGIDVDPSTGRAYVADRRNHRIDVFSPTGFLFAFGWGVDTGASALEKCTTATGCQQGLPGSGAGQFDRPVSVAVDSTAGAVYVFDHENIRVQKFDLEGNFLLQFGTAGTGACQIPSTDRPISVGPTGSVYVAVAGRVQKYSQAGVCEGEVQLVAPPLSVFQFAVDDGGNLYGSINGDGLGLRKYDSAGNQLCTLDPSISTTVVNTDSAGNVYVGQRFSSVNQPFEYSAVAEYNSSCAIQRRFGYEPVTAGPQAPLRGLAAYTSPQGNLYASRAFEGESGGMVSYLSFPPPGPIAPEGGVEAVDSSLSNTKALVRAEINPEGKATQYHFEYLTEAEWIGQGESFTGPATKASATQALSSTDFNLHGVEALLGCADPVKAVEKGEVDTCLLPETVYRFRVVAVNADGGGEGTTEGEPFETRPGEEFIDIFASDVGTDNARLGAELNPLGIPTTGYFEYVDDATFQESGFAEASRAPISGEVDFGAGEDPVSRTVMLPGLAPGTVYHYGISLSNPLISPDRVFQPEDDRILRTLATPTIDLCPGNEAFRTGLSTLLPDCRAFEMVSPLAKEGGNAIPLPEFNSSAPASLNQSSLSGDKVSYGTYRAFGDAEAGPYTAQYVAERGTTEWLSHTITPPRARLLTEVAAELDTEVKALSSDLCDAWLLTVAEPPLAAGAIPGYRNIYRRHDDGNCGTQSYEALTVQSPTHPSVKKEALSPELQGFSADHSVTIYTVNDNLEGTSAPDNPSANQQLYRHDQSGTEFVCILPGGAPSGERCSAGTRGGVFLTGQNRQTSLDNAISADGQRIFWTAYSSLSLGPGRIYVRIGNAPSIDVSKAGEEASGTSASVFLKANENGTKALYLTGNDLYEFDVDTKTTTPIAGEAAGIVGGTEDLGRIYLVSEELLSGANGEGSSPQVGKPNLYLREGGNFTFVATLEDKDVDGTPEAGEFSLVSFAPFRRNARITPGGQQMIFVSFGRLTGYDNTDASNGEIDAEVYRYDAAIQRLSCVSCNPTNARPEGSESPRLGTPFWAGGSIGGWSNTLYAPRNLSSDGNRVFFESSDVLSARDTNGISDVYQWEAPGTGGCSTASASYSSINDGCLDLISSGRSTRISEFNDASPSGGDAFFSTLSSLVSQDYGLVDVYDTRVGGGLPTPATPAYECEGETCQSPAPSPEAQAPASLDYQGPGDIKEAAKPRKCPKGKVKSKGRCVKKKHKSKKHGKAGKKGRAGR